MNRNKILHRMGLIAAIGAALLGTVTSCASPTATAQASQAAGEQAAKVEKNASTGIAKITLSEKAIERLGLRTDTVKAGSGETAFTLPYAALIYDSHGATWVYTNPEPRVYTRQAVTVTRIDGAVVNATAAPAVGTKVVTTGAAELFGAEFDTAH